MRSKSDFWLTLHKLRNDLEKEGSTPDERCEQLVTVLESLSPATVAAYLEDLETVLPTLKSLDTRCKTA